MGREKSLSRFAEPHRVLHPGQEPLTGLTNARSSAHENLRHHRRRHAPSHEQRDVAARFGVSVSTGVRHRNPRSTVRAIARRSSHESHPLPILHLPGDDDFIRLPGLWRKSTIKAVRSGSSSRAMAIRPLSSSWVSRTRARCVSSKASMLTTTTRRKRRASSPRSASTSTGHR